VERNYKKYYSKLNSFVKYNNVIHKKKVRIFLLMTITLVYPGFKKNLKLLSGALIPGEQEMMI
jgi:hypothetical protein